MRAVTRIVAYGMTKTACSTADLYAPGPLSMFLDAEMGIRLVLDELYVEMYAL
jgi:hypothetical protein